MADASGKDRLIRGLHHRCYAKNPPYIHTRGRMKGYFCAILLHSCAKYDRTRRHFFWDGSSVGRARAF